MGNGSVQHARHDPSGWSQKQLPLANEEKTKVVASPDMVTHNYPMLADIMAGLRLS